MMTRRRRGDREKGVISDRSAQRMIDELRLVPIVSSYRLFVIDLRPKGRGGLVPPGKLEIGTQQSMMTTWLQTCPEGESGEKTGDVRGRDSVSCSQTSIWLRNPRTCFERSLCD